MKLFKNTKLAVRISVCITVVTIIGMFVLWKVVDNAATTTLQARCSMLWNPARRL